MSIRARNPNDAHMAKVLTEDEARRRPLASYYFRVCARKPTLKRRVKAPALPHQ